VPVEWSRSSAADITPVSPTRPAQRVDASVECEPHPTAQVCPPNAQVLRPWRACFPADLATAAFPATDLCVVDVIVWRPPLAFSWWASLAVPGTGLAAAGSSRPRHRAARSKRRPAL